MNVARYLLLAVSLLYGAAAAGEVAAVAMPAAEQGNDSEQHARPNVLLVLADDLGFTDLGSYGSEINTPTLDALAQRGVRFSNYHTAANCAPARAMLLTGVDAHLAGVPNIPEMLAPEQTAYEHYAGVLGNNVVTIATLLEDAGYHTYMAGKWHLGTGPGKLPSERGFERTVALADSGADNWEQRPYLPIYDKANWYADGEEYDLPEDFYSSRFLVDRTIGFIDGHLDDGRPFFAYLPFQAVHMPVQAPQEFIDRYMGAYDEGWDALRARRRQRAISLGIIPATSEMDRMPTTLVWEDLDVERRRYEAKRMAVYAAMVEAMDFHLGRLFAWLEQRDALGNTLVIFTSDNGAEASGSHDQQSWLARRGPESLGYTVDYDSLGLEGSFNAISPSFASAAVSPLAYYKFYAAEGGMRVPLIVAAPDLPAKGTITDAFAYVTDLPGTILSYAGVEPPGERYAGRPVERMSGRDLRPLLLEESDTVYGPEEAVGYELAGHSALFQGDYKLLRLHDERGDGQWRLYHLRRDPGETTDLSALEPRRFQRMLSAYERYVRENQVLPVPEGYGHLEQLAINLAHERLRVPVLVALLTLLVLAPLIVAYRMRRQAPQ